MSSLFLFLTVVQLVVTVLLVAVILVQKSEGGGLGVGGSPAGFMSARGAADFLTRATQVLGGLFVGLSIILAALAVKSSAGAKVDESLNRSVPTAPASPSAPVDPLAKLNGSVTPVLAPAAAPSASPSPAPAPAGAAKQ